MGRHIWFLEDSDLKVLSNAFLEEYLSQYLWFYSRLVEVIKWET